MKRIALCLGALAAAPPLCASQAASPTPQPSTRHAAGSPLPLDFSIVPAKPILTQKGLTDPRNRIFRYSVNPGQTLSDVVAIVNRAKTPMHLGVRVSDAVTSPQGGGITFNDSSSSQQTVGRWLTLNAKASNVTIPSSSGALIGMTLQVPATTPPGEYEGAVSGINYDAQTIKQGKKIFHIHGQVRCLVYLRVHGHATMGLRIGKVTTTYRNGQTLLNMSVKNTGAVIDHVLAVLTFTRVGQHKPFAAQLPLGDILGGDTTSEVAPLNRSLLPSGIYRASIQVIYRGEPDESGPLMTAQITWQGMLSISS